MTAIDETTLAALERLERAVLKGPWEAYEVLPMRPGSWGVGPTSGTEAICEDCWIGPEHASFIAAIRNAAPALIAAARENARLRATLAAIAAGDSNATETARHALGREK